MAQMVKSPPATWENWVQSLGWDNFSEEDMATHSSILAWRPHGQRSLAGYSPWGHKELDITERPSAARNPRLVEDLPANAGDARDTGSIPGSAKIPWSRKWQYTTVFLPGTFHGQRNLVCTIHGAAKRQTQLDTAQHIPNPTL